MNEDELDDMLTDDVGPTVEDLQKANANLAHGLEICIQAMNDAKLELEGDTVWTADRWADAAENAVVHLDEALGRSGRSR
jgi:hypothetical protein